MASLRTAATDPIRHALLLVLVAGVAAVSGCGSGDETASTTQPDDEVVDVSGTDPLGEETAGSVAQLAQCRDWNSGTEAEKLATIEDIRSQVNNQDTGIEAPALSDDEAMEVFNASCKPSYAAGFRLYLIYARAAGVAPLLRDE